MAEKKLSERTMKYVSIKEQLNKMSEDLFEVITSMYPKNPEVGEKMYLKHFSGKVQALEKELDMYLLDSINEDIVCDQNEEPISLLPNYGELYKKFNLEKDLKNEAYFFIISSGLLDQFRVYTQNHKRENSHADCVNYLIKQMEEKENK